MSYSVQDWFQTTSKALLRGDWRTAFSTLRNAEDEVSHRLEYWTLLCATYAQAGRWEEVANFSASSAQRHPGEAIFWESWAWAEHNLGNTAHALEILNGVSGRFPNREHFAFTLACLFGAANRVPEAERWLQKAISLSSDRTSLVHRLATQPELRMFLNSGEQAFPA